MAADRKRRRRRAIGVGRRNGLLSFIVLAIIIAGAVAWYGVSQYYKAGPKDEQTAFLVEKGSGFGTIAQRLEDQGLIVNVLLFRGAYQLTKSGANI